MDKSDKMMDGFLLCDYNEDYNGIYVSSEDEADEELYYERQLQEVKYQEQYENGGKYISKCNELNEEELNEEELNEYGLNHEELNNDDLNHEEFENELKYNDDKSLDDDKSIDDDKSLDDDKSTDEHKSTDEDDDEIEFQLEELKSLIIQIENKIHILETNNSNMITTTFFINRKKYNDNLHDISILKNKKKEYEKSIEFIYKLQISIKYFQGH